MSNIVIRVEQGNLTDRQSELFAQLAAKMIGIDKSNDTGNGRMEDFTLCSECQNYNFENQNS